MTAALLIGTIHRARTSSANVVLDNTVQFQTIIGWEAVAQAGQLDAPRQFGEYQHELFDKAVFDLGLNRLRLEVKSPSGQLGRPFDLGPVDQVVELVVLPIRQRLVERGESLWLNVAVVGDELDGNPDLFASQVLELYTHLESQYAIVPDSLEILEPGHNGWRSARTTAEALLAAATLLESNGYEPYVIAPSSECGAVRALEYFNRMISEVPDLVPYVREFAYHRYCFPSEGDLQDVAELGERYGIQTAQLEHIGSGYENLHADLTLANVAAWEQYALAYPKCPPRDDGEVYFVISRCAGDEPYVQLGRQARLLRQYFRYVRRGAVRIAAGTTNPDFNPAAFINADGTQVVVIKAAQQGQISIAGLPVGNYGVTYATDQEASLGFRWIRISPDETLLTEIPAAGVVTVFDVRLGRLASAHTPCRCR